jgi:hypothetical protein
MHTRLFLPPFHYRRIEELKAKEESKVRDLLATLGLKPGDKVTIQPRASQS